MERVEHQEDAGQALDGLLGKGSVQVQGVDERLHVVAALHG
eukprot:CAMPEP_0176108838 /NCGR_PEP_ID=MMETSP0120_2-20121206/54641_1 /TAXON_ID=160619 /ORGANISM="Kryptoperidinium foliaceum, Strain CCMP 1326" /LENGTH=40 /DNA_ID= /DNA_START= /DNA_END= /DNA_ORIENTATION=